MAAFQGGGTGTVTLRGEISAGLSLRLPSSSRVSYFAVFDGHGGIRASKFAAQNLHQNLIRKFPKGQFTPRAPSLAGRGAVCSYSAARVPPGAGGDGRPSARSAASTLLSAVLGTGRARLGDHRMPPLSCTPRRREQRGEDCEEMLAGHVQAHGRGVPAAGVQPVRPLAPGRSLSMSPVPQPDPDRKRRASLGSCAPRCLELGPCSCGFAAPG